VRTLRVRVQLTDDILNRLVGRFVGYLAGSDVVILLQDTMIRPRDSCNYRMAARINDCPAASSTQCSRTSAVPMSALVLIFPFLNRFVCRSRAVVTGARS
jgi:hypothetical protein